MTYKELQDRMIAQSHRKDMATRIPGFIDDARGMLNYRLSLELAPFVNDDDTNDILTDNWLLYYYAAMRMLYEFIYEFETAMYFDQQYQYEMSNYYINRKGQDPLAITPQEPLP